MVFNQLLINYTNHHEVQLHGALDLVHHMVALQYGIQGIHKQFLQSDILQRTYVICKANAKLTCNHTGIRTMTFHNILQLNSPIHTYIHYLTTYQTKYIHTQQLV